MGVGRARKSMGNVTYRNVRGRTIGSQKRGENTGTRAPGIYSMAEFMFAAINMYSDAHKEDIKVSFSRTKYGSERNYFFKINYAALKEALQPLFDNNQNVAELTVSSISAAITTYATANPETIYRVKRSGYSTKYLTGAWNSSDNPEEPAEPIVLRISFNGASHRAAEGISTAGITMEISTETGETQPLIISGTGIGTGVTAITLVNAEGESVTATITDFEATADRVSASLYAETTLGNVEFNAVGLTGRGTYVIRTA